ncbi:MAG: hypothetical protein WCF67_14300 [Chitinophagaceae bacterium]
MINWFLYSALLCVLISYISSLRAFRLDVPEIFRQFSYFLLFVFLSETFGMAWPRWIYQHTPFAQTNQWFYVFFHFIMYLFYLYFFYKVLQRPKPRKVVKLLAVIYILFASINLLFIEGVMKLNIYSDLLASFIMVFLSIVYYYQLLKAREVISLKNDIAFWISTGIFIFHLGSLMGNFLINYVYKTSPTVALMIHHIIQVSSMVMYLTYSIAYLCHRKK